MEKSDCLQTFFSWLLQAREEKASDLHLHAGQPLFFRVDGQLRAYSEEPLPENKVRSILSFLLSAEQKKRLQEDRLVDFSWCWREERFRVHAFWQRNRPAIVFRRIPGRIPCMSELGCARAWNSFFFARRGLILVSGATGSGKTTTLAAFLEEINRKRAVHVISLEDPIEFVHESQKALMSQRELGQDFLSFPQGVRSALREDPDILLIGELRDAESVFAALSAAETGHLVLGTLHTDCAADAILRLEGLFPPVYQGQMRELLASVLSAVFVQRLFPGLPAGRVCATEVLLGSPAVRNLIRTGKLQQLVSAMQSGQSAGMQTMRQAVETLYAERKISVETWQQFQKER